MLFRSYYLVFPQIFYFILDQTSVHQVKNLIFDLMNGSLVLDEVKDLWKDQVVDEFAKGSYCSELYEEVYQAKVSLCNRLGVQEDSDIETVISNLLLIGKHLSMKMFDYGMEEERKQEKKHI